MTKVIRITLILLSVLSILLGGYLIITEPRTAIHGWKFMLCVLLNTLNIVNMIKGIASDHKHRK